jgi:hypothetical protein
MVQPCTGRYQEEDGLQGEEKTDNSLPTYGCIMEEKRDGRSKNKLLFSFFRTVNYIIFQHTATEMKS